MLTTKTPKIEAELKLLQIHNPRLYSLLEMLSKFSELELGKDIMITSILRTQAEHDALYAATEASKRPTSSPHMFWEAVDIRSAGIPPIAKSRMLNFLNQFSFRNGKQVAMCHAIAGGAEHFHIQYAKAKG